MPTSDNAGFLAVDHLGQALGGIAVEVADVALDPGVGRLGRESGRARRGSARCREGRRRCRRSGFGRPARILAVSFDSARARRRTGRRRRFGRRIAKASRRCKWARYAELEAGPVLAGDQLAAPGVYGSSCSTPLTSVIVTSRLRIVMHDSLEKKKGSFQVRHQDGGSTEKRLRRSPSSSIFEATRLPHSERLAPRRRRKLLARVAEVEPAIYARSLALRRLARPIIAALSRAPLIPPALAPVRMSRTSFRPKHCREKK